MDVRCEKCLTVYDFDDTQIGSAGVTVKCTQCGNLFKVRRRSDTREMPIAVAVARSPQGDAGTGGEPDVTRGSRPQAIKNRPGSGPHSAGPSGAVTLPPPQPPLPAVPKPPTPTDNGGQWMMRLATSGEVFRFREMTTLQQWIVERKVVRDDEISRDGVTWKALGGIPELDAFFRTVAQAMAAERPSSLPVSDWEGDDLGTPRPAPVPNAVRRPLSSLASGPVAASGPVPMPANVGRGSGPSMMGDGPDDDDVEERPLPPKREKKLPAVVDELANQDFDSLDDGPARRSRWPFIVVPLVLLVGGGAWLLASGKLGKQENKNVKVLADAQTKLALDSDDGFREAAALFLQAHNSDETATAPLAGQAETAARFAFYLREDAHSLEGGGAANQSVAQSLRRQAQAQLDGAKKTAADALSMSPDAPDVNRAMGESLRVDGAPAAEVERYLRRAADHAAGDPENVFALGALSFRDGKNDEARQRLEQANTLSEGLHHQIHVGASYLLAKLALATGRRPDAQKLVDAILKQSPQHDRARALIAGSMPTVVPDMGTVAAIPPPTGITPPPTGITSPPTGNTPPPTATPTSGGNDYAKLVAQADKLIENGHTDQARKLYDKALAANPSGLEAITGIGYCDLDRERYMAAIDHFKQALSVSSEYGEALIGLAEAYKVQGNKAQAVDFYKRYLKASPGGEKAAMAQKNVKELESKLPKAPDVVEPVKSPELPKAPEPAKVEPEAVKPEPVKEPEPKTEKKPDDKPASDAPPP